jgi:predicted esterase YcpF (UPF0227 family)
MSGLTLLYLHGFLSSPASEKACQTRRYAESLDQLDDILVPELKSGPAETVAQLLDLVAGRDTGSLGLIGSSLGGFYATVLAERLQAPAVLINPAVHPAQYWQGYLGEHRNFHSGEIHEVTRAHIEQLEALDPPTIASPEKYLVFLQRHDEVLDYRQALRRYGDAQCLLRDDGDHAYAGFDRELPAAFDFLLQSIFPN